MKNYISTMPIFKVKEHQKEILNQVLLLNQRNTLYFVVQQKIKGPNYTLNELKKHLKRSVKEYIKRKNPNEYYDGKENELVGYYAFFETSHNFSNSQNEHNIFESNIYSGFHFHLFIAGVDQDFYSELEYQFNKQKNKKKCINEIIAREYEMKSLSHDFILYHTKQMKDRYSPQLVLKNFEFEA